jgi:hypothetical protein
VSTIRLEKVSDDPKIRHSFKSTTGGYLWSPKRSKNGARNPFYEFMREIAPGDLILSFEGAHIRAIGVARSFAYECPKPPEFGSAGPNWSLICWKVDVGYQVLANQVRPADSHGGRYGNTDKRHVIRRSSPTARGSGATARD